GNGEFATGTFRLSDADGLDDLQSVTLNGTTVALGSLAGSVFAGSNGSLTITAYDSLTGVASYSYELTSPTSDGPGLETEVFSLSVSDGTASSAPASIVIEIIDDVPTAFADTNSVEEGGVTTGNALTDGTDDVFGADGPTVGGGVVGVKVGNDTATPASGGLGVALVGSFGTLTLNANGTYSYDGAPNVVPPAGATDVFTYTIQDGDGDLSTTTLTITLTDGGLQAGNDDQVLVFENGLDTSISGSDIAAGSVTGSLPGDAGETDASNTLTDNVTGGFGSKTYALLGSAVGAFGTIQINADGSYVYTLTSPYDTSPDANNGANTEQNRDSFTYQVTDANGNTGTATIFIDIVDDVPTASFDSNSVNEGALLTVNAAGGVLSNDEDGADGFAAGGGVVGVRAAAGDTTTAVTTGVGGSIVGLYGTLTLAADGSYSYQSNADTISSNVSDVFVYTIKDGDGDLSTTTLTINLNDSNLQASNDDQVLVYEKALDTSISGSDIAAGSVTGSLPGDAGETDASNTLTDNVTGGFGSKTYALLGSAVGAFGTIQINADGSYVYTLTSPYDTSPDANNGANTEQNRDSFTYQVTDANGNTGTATIYIDIVDDVPLAFAPVRALLVDQVPSSHTVTAGLNFADVAGADGVGTVVFSNFTEGDLAKDAYGQQLFLNGEALHLYYGTDQTQLVAKTLANDVGLLLDIDPASDTYALTTYGVISNGAIEVTTTNLSGVGAGNVAFKGLLNIGGTTQDVLISTTTAGGSVNSDIDDIGVSNQWIDTGEKIRFDLVNGLATGGANGTGFVYTDHNQANNYRQRIFVKGGGGNTATLIVTAIIADNDYVFGTSDAGEPQVDLSTSDIKVFNGAVDVTGLVTLSDGGNSITIGGMKDGWTFQVSSATSFSAVHVEGGGGEDFSLGFFSYSQLVPGQPIDLTHAITATDGDGDAITSAINSTLYPLTSSVEGNSSDNVMTGTSGVDHLFGYGGNDSLSGLLENDVLSGGDGNDTLNGGLGNDLLSGGSGKDTLVWNSGDTGVDHITDFFIDGPGVTGGNSDVLELSQLLVGETASGNVLDDYLSFTFAATSSTIDVRATAGGAVVQQVVLDGVDLSSGAYYGSTDAATVIDGMLNDNALKVDTV
uniref:beta strand repeat-containing protein n=1 Tax=Pseudomonas sp. 2FE TaxID=2502190 RepID=UPI001C49AD40